MLYTVYFTRFRILSIAFRKKYRVFALYFNRLKNYTFSHYALIQLYVSLYKLSIERYYIEGLYEVTYNCITSGLSADQKTAEPPPGSSAVCHSRSIVADLRAGKSLVIVGKSKVAGKSPAKVAHSSESEDS